MDDDSIVSVRIMGRAGKAVGKNKYWYNVEYTAPGNMQGVQQSIDLSTVVEVNVNGGDGVNVSDGEQSEPEAVFVLEDVSMGEAMTAELNSWKQNHVYTEVENEGQKCVSTRWIYTMKTTKDGMLVQKARLVARGFEEAENELLAKDSPTCGKESLKVVLAVMAQNNWQPHSMDIKTAFLQGQEIDRQVYIKPPKEANVTGKLWQLKKCVYGLGDASLQWYKRVKQVMYECGAQMSSVDPAVFYWSDDSGELLGVLACHVDDFIWAGDIAFEDTVINGLRLTFNVGREDNVPFQYTGMGLLCVQAEIKLHQNAYADGLKMIDVPRMRAMQKDSSLSDDEQHTMRSKVGQILWIAHQSRPDIIYDACHLSTKLKGATVEDLLDCNKVIRRIKSDRQTLRFQHLGEAPLSLVVFSDASLGNLPDGGSQGGYLILLVGEQGKFSPICWNSKRIRRVVRSTLAAETLALADGIDTALYVSALYTELTSGAPDVQKLPLVCVTDCKSLYEAVKSTKCVAEKRLRMELSSIKELSEKCIIKRLVWTKSERQLADCLTKRGASAINLMKTLDDGILSVRY